MKKMKKHIDGDKNIGYQKNQDIPLFFADVFSFRSFRSRPPGAVGAESAWERLLLSTKEALGTTGRRR